MITVKSILDKVNAIIMNAFLNSKRPSEIGQAGLDLIKEFEGFESKPYIDPVGIPTIGFGATYYIGGQKVTMDDEPITETEAKLLLKEMLKPYESAVSKFVNSKINQNQFDALVSFAYNVGTMALKNSTLLKKVNQNPNQLTIGSEFAKWNKGTVKGKKVELKGLTRRRKAESDLYFKI